MVATPVMIMGLAACGGEEAGKGDSGKDGAKSLSGTIKIDGSSTVGPLTIAAGQLFKQENSGVNTTVAISGTGGGFEKFCAGETDISNASRPIKDDEEAPLCEKAGVKYTELHIANDALSVVVSKDNDWAECLTVEQLKKIWEPGSKAKTWKDVDAKFPAEPLKLFGPGTDSGTFEYFTEEINGEKNASREDYTASEDDNVLVQGVSGTKGGLGYFGYTYFEENQDKLKVVKIDGGKGCVAPSAQAAQDGSYTPLARPLFIYPSEKALGRPEVKAFIDYFVKNNKSIAEKAKFIPLSTEQESELTAAAAKLK
ncbi:PstS family phosphate ABC transporter substrate-binding protein [Streptomyces polyrhachis]|uniref:Phosphate-binding protein n=1 Tax=Streptomyces polyrhachis TaxID=1282885 RepID=A0ABW2GC35_9ACTN